MWSTCSLSGEQIEHPVVSRLSGHIFEKRLIEKHIESTQTCPITGRPMSLEDLVHVKVLAVQKPRPLTATSIPNMLGLLQNEWDALLLEQFQLKQHLEQVRQELTHALYQHDAACRVIARVMKERDQARTELAQLQQRVQEGRMDTEPVGDRLPEQITIEVEDMAVKLNNQRKLRRKQTDWLNQFPTSQILSNFSAKTLGNIPHAVALDVNDSYVVVGTANGEVHVLEDSVVKVKATPHSQKVTQALFLKFDEKTRFLTASEDGHLEAHHYEEPGKLTSTYKFNNEQPIVGVAIHPLQYLVLVASKDGTFTYHDLQRGALVGRVVDFKGLPLHSVAIHPDGHFAALGGSDGSIKIWKICAHQVIAQLESHTGPVTHLSFSENGTTLASAGNGVVNVWNLRTSEVQKQIDQQGHAVGALVFDDSAQYLAIASNDNVFLLETKKYDTFNKFTTQRITALKFGTNTRSIVMSTVEGTVNKMSE